MKTFMTLLCTAAIVLMASFLTKYATIEDVVTSCHEQGWYLLRPVDDQLKNGAILFCKPMTSDEVLSMTGDFPVGWYAPGYKPALEFQYQTLGFTERAPYNELPDWYHPNVDCTSDPDDLLDLQECPR